ncbi:MAG: hypothetical protein J3K34DRAFT_441932 [Monoraphidium minutum]|nr:MAG: hypothetical protein J3K34DRAFT_441932 [Monoraphidium minutum]
MNSNMQLQKAPEAGGLGERSPEAGACGRPPALAWVAGAGGAARACLREGKAVLRRRKAGRRARPLLEIGRGGGRRRAAARASGPAGNGGAARARAFGAEKWALKRGAAARELAAPAALCGKYVKGGRPAAACARGSARRGGLRRRRPPPSRLR